MRRIIGLLAFAFATSASFAASEDSALLRAFYRFRIAESTMAQANQLAAETDAEAGGQIQSAAENWKAGVLRSLRSELERQFGSRARIAFQQFVGEFTQAEKAGDLGYLQAVAGASSLAPMPGNYDELARIVLQTQLQPEMESAANFLGEIETWLSIRSQNTDAPPLDMWLHRNAPTAAQASHVTPPPPPRPRNPLRDAEVPATDFVATGSDDDAGLSTFSAARSERRAKALDQAQAGMQQVAAERDAAEKEYAAAKMAAAQAEAEAMKKHAEKLAAVEQEALEQRKNSWSGRLKQIVSSTLGAAGGAFFGGIGSRAGEAAANAVFKE